MSQRQTSREESVGTCDDGRVTDPDRTDPSTSLRMSRQRSRDTSPEQLLRRELHRRGLRYRIHARPVASLRREADIVFRPARVAVFVDGCFWHSCPIHGSMPRRNADFWREKLARNVERDRETDQLLEADGWLVVRVWEHEDLNEAADRVASAVRDRRS